MLLIALTLIILKLGFLLLLVAGPFFLIVGVHPGFGRVVAIRWFEMLVGVLLKQVAVALVLSVLLYCYSLIMSTTDQELPWALKIMMISLVTVAVFIYRKPFQHLFSSVGYGMLGANERAEASWRESAFGFRRVSATATGTSCPARRRPARPGGRAAPRPMAAGGADGAGTGAAEGGVRATSSDGMSGGPTADSHSATRQWPAAGVGTGRTAPPLPLPTNGAPPTANGGSAGWASGGGGTGPARADPRSRQSAPPVRCPPRPRRHPGRRRPPRGHRGRPGPPRRGRRQRRRHRRSPRRRPRRRSGRGPAVGPSSGAGHGTLARQAAAAVCRRRHRARRPWHLRDPRAERREHGGAARDPDPDCRARARQPRAGRLPGRRPPRSSPAASSPAASPTATAGGANIYQWLPFTQSDLTTAAKTTLAFANVYANTSYTETKAAYAGKLAGLTTSQEAATLVSDFESPEIAATRTADKQVATGTPTIDSISSFGPEPRNPGPPSITFAVTIAQKLVSTSGTITSTPEYTITTVSTATGWQVENIQLASLGNQ